jgi:hypothetical protein
VSSNSADLCSTSLIVELRHSRAQEAAYTYIANFVIDPGARLAFVTIRRCATTSRLPSWNVAVIMPRLPTHPGQVFVLNGNDIWARVLPGRQRRQGAGAQSLMACTCARRRGDVCDHGS